MGMKLYTLLQEAMGKPISESYFNTELPEEDKAGKARYIGRDVAWYGYPNQMIVIHKDFVHGMWGNIYDPEKLQYVVDMIQNEDDRDGIVEFECSYGMGSIITLTSIEEQQQSYHNDEFTQDYDGLDNPASTGNEELDRYLGVEYMDELDFVSDWGSSPDVVRFFSANRGMIARGKQTPESLTQTFKTLSPDEEELEAFKEFLRIEGELKQAQDTNQGDFNKFMVQLRDGHHRVMGAIEAGEDYICINLVEEDIKDFEGRYRLVTTI